MTEADWLKAKDPDAMLRVVAERLTPRRWHLLACAVVRRAGDAIPTAGPFWPAVEYAEQNPAKAPSSAPVKMHLAAVRKATLAAVDAAEQAQQLIVAPADPDADPNEFRETSDRKTNPSAPLFRSASLHASTAIRLAGEAAEQAVGAVTLLIAERPGPTHLARVRDTVVEATRLRSAASLYANAALDLKARGDDAADRNTGKNVNVQLAAAQDTVTRTDEHLGYKTSDLQESRAKSDRKAVGRFLLELVGNPFTPYRFDPAWRTETAVEVARGIYQDRAFDRMPILADALLDADCDEEAVLRHCRGTEAHTPDGVVHARGCWVLELILEHEPALFTAEPVKAPKPPPRPRRVAGTARPTPPDGIARLLEAMGRDANLTGDDEE